MRPAASRGCQYVRNGRAPPQPAVSYTLAMNRRLRAAVKPPRDPGFGALRRAARAATVIPLIFAFADVLLRDAQSLIFVLFGCFSLLVISDFGGLRRPRALAYLTATVAGGRWWRWERSPHPLRGLP